MHAKFLIYRKEREDQKKRKSLPTTPNEQIARLQGKGLQLNVNTTIKIKLRGDGTNIGRRLKIDNITYTILNEKDTAMSERGKYVLVIIKRST